jgi:glycosyltransferase involved in cell wall biosynthesis
MVAELTPRHRRIVCVYLFWGRRGTGVNGGCDRTDTPRAARRRRSFRGSPSADRHWGRTVRICFIAKYPPIQGGVSAQTYWTCHLLARAGHAVFVVTNADETEAAHRIRFLPGDSERLEAWYPSGGCVRVSFTQAVHDPDLYYIPEGKPTLTRLASLAVEVVRGNDCELILGWYLEPYVVVASLVAAFTGRPYLIRHAGSDLQELAAQPELGPAYREAIRGSAGVLSLVAPSAGLGLPDEKCLRLPGLYLPAEFTPDGDQLGLAETARFLTDGADEAMLRSDPPSPGLPLLGMYGKLGPSKGTIDLIHAVRRVRDHGRSVGLVLVGGGRGWPAVIDAVRETDMADLTWTLPMLAPWRIPSLIRRCTAVAFLERMFEVAQHRPVPPIEILACGRPLLLSKPMVANVLPGRPPTDPLFAAIEVVDPQDDEGLAAALSSVLSRSGATREQLAPSLRSEQEVASWYDGVFHRAVRRRCAGPGVPPTAASAARELTRRCPMIAAVLGQDADAWSAEAAPQAPNALFAAFQVADRSLPRLRREATSADAAERRRAQQGMAEHHALWTRVDVEGMAGSSAFACPVARVPDLLALADELRSALVPVVSRWLRLVHFDIDAFSYLQALQDGAPDRTEVRDEEQTLLFHKAPNLVRTVSRVGPVVATFLAQADGTRTLGAHLDRLGVPPQRRSSFVGVVARLHDGGVISFTRPAVTGLHPAVPHP